MTRSAVRCKILWLNNVFHRSLWWCCCPQICTRMLEIQGLVAFIACWGKPQQEKVWHRVLKITAMSSFPEDACLLKKKIIAHLKSFGCIASDSEMKLLCYAKVIKLKGAEWGQEWKLLRNIWAQFRFMLYIWDAAVTLWAKRNRWSPGPLSELNGRWMY